MVERWLPKPKVVGSNPISLVFIVFIYYKKNGNIAQLVELWIFNPKVSGSNPDIPIKYYGIFNFINLKSNDINQ